MTKSAKKVEVAEKEIDRSIPNAIAAQTYWLGKTPYRPRVAHTMASWEKMSKLLIKGAVKGADLAAVLVQHTVKLDETHFDFVSYLERRGALTTVEPKK